MKNEILSCAMSACTRKAVLIAAVSLACTGNVFSQEATGSMSNSRKTEWGFKVGLNIASIGTSNTDLSDNLNPVIGGAAGLTFAGRVAQFGDAASIRIHTGLEASLKGFEFEASSDVTCSALYIQAPIAAGVQIDLWKAKFELRTGVYLAYGVAGETKFSNGSDNMKTFGDDILKPFDAGMLIGAYCTYNRFVFGIHGELGFLEPNADNFTITGAKAHTSNASFTVGFIF